MVRTSSPRTPKYKSKNMKKLFILFAILIATSAMAQEPSRISYISLKKDTLILPKDTIGTLIFKSWDNITAKRPIILFADEYTIKQRNEWLNKRTKRKS